MAYEVTFGAGVRPVELDADGVRLVRGPAGPQGVPGISPHVGANGNWWVGSTDTGVPAAGGGENQPLLAAHVADCNAHPYLVVDGNNAP